MGARPVTGAEGPLTVDVAIGILVEAREGASHVFIARRPRDKVLGGFWELPGGKLERGESARACVVREFHEEVGLVVDVNDALPVLEHAYAHGRVRLHPFYCARVSGEARSIEVSEWRWVKAVALPCYRFPPANRALIEQVARELGPGSAEATKRRSDEGNRGGRAEATEGA